MGVSLDIFWISVGCLLDIFWRSFGRLLDVFSIFLRLLDLSDGHKKYQQFSLLVVAEEKSAKVNQTFHI